jgi:hypothetical protein
MPEKPPFDPVRACFWLLGAVIAMYGVAVVVGLGVCVMHFQQMDYECDKNNRLIGLLAGLLAAVIAVLGGFSRGPPKE